MSIGIIIGLLVVGGAIGAYARIRMPGRSGAGMVTTVFAGMAAAIVGGFIAQFKSDAEWLSWLVGIMFAVIVVVLLAAGTGRTDRGRTYKP